MRRIRKLILPLLALCLLTGCKPETTQDDGHIQFSATFYPLYALTDMLIQDVPDVSLSCLVQPQDGCLRSYSLSDWDLVLLARSADAIIAGGEGLEAFEDTLLVLMENGIPLVQVLPGMDLHTEEIQTSVDFEDEIPHNEGTNPHIYMKTNGAIEIANRICTYLGLIDPAHAEAYEKNLESVQNRLKSLQDELDSIAGETQNVRVALMNEATVYVAQEFGLEVAGWIDRESGEDMGPYELEDCLAALADMNVQYLLLERQAPASLINALKDAGYMPILIDILSTRHASEGAEGYFEAMRANARALNAAISQDN